MKDFLQCMDRLIKKLGLAEMALLELCLFSVGMLFGLALPLGRRKKAMIQAGVCFALSYGPLVARFLQHIAGEQGSSGL